MLRLGIDNYLLLYVYKLSFLIIYLMLYVFSGVVIRIWGPLEPGERLEATTMMLGNSITVRRKISDTSSSQEMRDVFKNYWEKYNDNPLLGRDNILASICPKVYRFIVT